MHKVNLVFKDGLNNPDVMSATYSELFERMLPFIEYSIHTPKPEKPEDDWNARFAAWSGAGINNKVSGFALQKNYTLRADMDNNLLVMSLIQLL